MEPIFELAFSPEQLQRGQIQQQLQRVLTDAIIQGRLKSGEKMPASRVLASQLSIARNSVVACYDALVSQGYLVSKTGAGTFVANIAQRQTNNSGLQPQDKRLRRYWQQASLFSASDDHAYQYDFAVGQPDISEFPFHYWQRCLRKASGLQAHQQLAKDDAQGILSLRQAIAHFVSQSRAVACGAQQIVITQGAQQAFDLISRLLVEPGKTVVGLESPGYPMVRMAFKAAGALIRDIAVDYEGICVSDIPQDVDIIYVTPSHQFPTGVAMSAHRRQLLLNWAHQGNKVIIEDDYDSEFRLTGRPIDALKSHDHSDNVFYVGTFAKCMLPDLRLGFVVVPDWARCAMVKARQHSDWHSSCVTQHALAQFIGEGFLLKHLRRMRRVYRERYQAIIDCIRQYSNQQWQVIPIIAGVHVAIRLSGVQAKTDIIGIAKAHNIKVHTSQQFSPGASAENLLVLGFGHIKVEDIKPAIQTLTHIL
ncbi:PLP-dependent aminotransferase family protein [Neptunicella marina]|uniref:PLP-dependent aminotransferase family protein n=1 Tax=Neptunicella marina TaxID=2125989 RepID=A0A8J6ITV1_9ALTE|nr:PLP-dependent aminotransferase family protein [Neptunicella marina]MBC3765702.1 PLP-dependent aminotransferase family protein [Neptunicella marina]